MWAELRRWRGILLIAVVSIATLWLTASGRLVLYIHPRYLVFTAIMAGVALLFCTARVVMVVRSSRQVHDHDDEDDDPEPTGRAQRLLSVGALLVAALVAVAMIVLPPATLSSATALQRDVTAGAAAGGASLSTAATASDAATKNYTVLEWSSLLQQTTDLSFFAGKPVDVTGFVSPDPSAPDDVFFVTRFVITCCAVDAQPVGVPVYQPDWRSSFAPNTWLRVTGRFEADPSSASTQPIALRAAGVKKVDEPKDPYLY